ncbi:MAG: hypothetical protein KAH01_03255 [Caldisericia bacterium]|nr:hypothetical protein [Caldisericia bacterium]
MKTLKEKNNNQKWYKEWWIWLLVFIATLNITFIVFQVNSHSILHKQNSIQQTEEMKNKEEMLNSLLNNPDFLYVSELEHQTDQWATLFSNFYHVLQSSQNTNSWRENILVELVSMKLLVIESNSITPPEDMINIHNQYIKAISHFDYMIENIPQALENSDKELTEKCMNELTIGAKELQKTKDLISSFSEENEQISIDD